MNHRTRHIGTALLTTTAIGIATGVVARTLAHPDELVFEPPVFEARTEPTSARNSRAASWSTWLPPSSP